MARERDIEEDDVDTDVKDKPIKDVDVKIEVDEDDEEDKKVVSDDDIAADDDARLAYDEDGEDGPEERGTRSRRKRRNEAKRRAQKQSAEEIAFLKQQLAQVSHHVEGLTRGQIGLAAQDIDGQIRNLQGSLDQIDDAIEASFADEDRVRGGRTHRQALKLRDEANSRLNALAYEKQRLNGLGRAPQQEQQRQTQNAPDPAAIKYSKIFMERHEWFDPSDGTDEDSMIVKGIDDTLANEGYLPNTKRYWVELERRIKARGIGQNSEGDDDVEDDEIDERSVRTERKGGGMATRAGRNGGGGRRPAGTGFRLTADMKDTLDQLGLLDERSMTDDQKKYRRQLVGKWESGMKDARAEGKIK